MTKMMTLFRWHAKGQHAKLDWQRQHFNLETKV